MHQMYAINGSNFLQQHFEYKRYGQRLNWISLEALLTHAEGVIKKQFFWLKSIGRSDMMTWLVLDFDTRFGSSFKTFIYILNEVASPFTSLSLFIFFTHYFFLSFSLSLSLSSYFSSSLSSTYTHFSFLVFFLLSFTASFCFFISVSFSLSFPFIFSFFQSHFDFTFSLFSPFPSLFFFLKMSEKWAGVLQRSCDEQYGDVLLNSQFSLSLSHL